MSIKMRETTVSGAEEVENTQVRRVRSFLFFKTEWWETILTRHIGSDIYIESDRPIRNVYLNGKLLPNVEQP